MNLIGLSFFLFLENGETDMLIFKFLKSAKDSKKFYINNYGKHVRDFTYIKDVIDILDKMRFKKFKNNFDVFNICSNKPIKLLDIINYINSKIKSKPKIIKEVFKLEIYTKLMVAIIKLKRN